MNLNSLILNMESMGIAGLIACTAVTIVIAVLIFAFGVPHEKREERGGLRGFLNFDVMLVIPFFKFLYILVAVAIFVFGIGSIIAAVMGLVEYTRFGYELDAGQLVATILIPIVAIVVLEFVFRFSFEMFFLFLRLVSDVASIRQRVDSPLGATSTMQAGRAWQPTQAQGAAHQHGANAGPRQGQQERATMAMPPAQQRPYQGTPMQQQAVPQQHVTSQPPQQASSQQWGLPADIAMSATRRGDTEDFTSILTQSTPSTWTCRCGESSNTGNYCVRCGRSRA